MIKEILHKHAVIGLNNGTVIEGFVQDADETYFRMVEWDNNIVIVRIDDISFARLTAHSEPPLERFRPQPIQQVQQDQSIPIRPIQQPAEMPPPTPQIHAVQLDEEGFAIGLPRGTVTMECPAQAPIAGQDDGTYGQPFIPRSRR